MTYQNTELANDLYNSGNDNVIMVVALYEDEKTSVGVAKIFTSGVNIIEKAETTFNVYPNPAKDFVKISANNNQISIERVYNMLGMMVDEIEVNSNEVEINVSDYNSGIYFFNVDGKTYKIIRNEE